MDVTKTQDEARIADHTPPAVFSFLTDEVVSGEGDIQMPGLPNLSGFLKRFLVGGEVKMHTHQGEDHYFFVLGGEVTFHLEKEENVVVVPKGDGVLIPRGTHYRFQSTGSTKALVLRVANEARKGRRVDPQGNPTPEFNAYPQAPRRTLPFLP